MTEPDLVEVLIGAFERWDRAAAVMPRYPTAGTLRIEAAAKEDAIAALGLDTNQFHRAVAEQRRRHIAGHPHGMDIGSAVLAALLELGVSAPHPPRTIDHMELKEAS